MEVEPIVVYYSVSNGGDGSAYPQWYLSQEVVEWIQECYEPMYDMGWGEPCWGSVETYVGSDVHKSAIKNEEYLPKMRAEYEEWRIEEDKREAIREAEYDRRRREHELQMQRTADVINRADEIIKEVENNEQ
jgi:hypothetical protein